MRSSILLKLTCLILIILLVFTGSMVVSRMYINKVVHTSSETLCESLLRQADSTLSLYEDNLRYNASYLCRYSLIDELNRAAQRSAAEDGGIEPDEARSLQLSSYFSQIVSRNREIVSALLFDRNMREVECFGRSISLPERQRYLRTAEDMNADWYFGDGGDFYYAYYYPIYSVIDGMGQQAGMCVFILERWAIDGTVRNVLGDYSSAMLLSDSRNLDLSFHSVGLPDPGITMEEIRQNPDYIYREGDWQNGIRIAVGVCVSANTQGSSGIRKLIASAYTIGILLLAILICFSYFEMAHPIHQITRFIDRAITHPDDRLHFQRSDDIAVVAASLNRMLDENQEMIRQIREDKIRLYETQLARQKMEILAYRNQINPHFLYNTLSCMRDMALFHDEDDIAEMAMSLSDIFRYAVKGSNIVTVRDEIEYMEKYASIINHRFMGKITIETIAADEVLDKPVIRFFLQPLVENSVFHGLEESIEPGFVDIGIALIDGRIEISVEDDGCGMDAATLEKVRAQISRPEESSSIGISNIVQRLRLFYGEDFTITIDSTPGEGTITRISIPDHMKE